MSPVLVAEMDAPVLKPIHPPGFSSPEFPNTGIEVQFHEVRIPRHVQTVIPIWAIETQRGVYEATLPISVKLAFEDGAFYAANDALKLFGTGDSPDEAIGELRDHLAFFIEHYEEADAANLAGEASRMKTLYQQAFIFQGNAIRAARN